MLVLRIETPDGEGPYRRSSRIVLQPRGMLWQNTQPVPSEDIVVSNPHGYDYRPEFYSGCSAFLGMQMSIPDSSECVFGFDSYEQFKRWTCKTDRRKLKDAGYELSLYRTKNYVRYEKQVVFTRDVYIGQVCFETGKLLLN